MISFCLLLLTVAAFNNSKPDMDIAGLLKRSCGNLSPAECQVRLNDEEDETDSNTIEKTEGRRRGKGSDEELGIMSIENTLERDREREREREKREGKRRGQG